MTRRRTLLLFVCVALAYGNALGGSFQYDDFHSIVDNYHIRRLANVPVFFQDPALFSADSAKAMYRPILLTTYALNYAIGEYREAGYRLVNVFLHAFNACLVAWLAGLLGVRPTVRFTAGIFFILHPISSETVNYISSRSESLAAFFFLVSICLFEFRGVARSFVCRVASVGAFGFGLCTKSSVIILPALLLLMEGLSLTRRPEQRHDVLKRHAPYWMLAAAYLTLIWSNGFLAGSLSAPARSFFVQLLTQIKALSYYGLLLSCPLRLNVEHQFFEEKSPLTLAFILACFLALTFIIGQVLLWRRGCYRAVFLCAWMGATLLPVMVVPLNVLVNEHRLYLPAVAFCIGMALVLDRLAYRRRVSDNAHWGGLPRGILVGTYGVLTFLRCEAWSDPLSLWQSSATRSPDMPRVQVHLGNALSAAGRPDEARDAFVSALTLDPAHRTARANLATLHYEEGRRAVNAVRARQHYQFAIDEYNRVLEIDSTYAEALNGLGNTWLMLGLTEGARRAYERAVAAQPHFYPGYFNLGDLLLSQGQYAAAATSYRRGLLLKEDTAAYEGLGEALFRLDRFEEAPQAYRRLVGMVSGDPGPLYNLGIALLRWGEAMGPGKQRDHVRREAELVLRRVLKLVPSYGQAQALLKQLSPSPP